MGALPKNKITRAERGKRRAGNTPSLTKQANHTTVPLHKRGMVNQLLQALGLTAVSNKPASKAENKKAARKAKAPAESQNKAIQAKLARENNKSSMQKGVNKPAVRRTSLNKDA